jgi:hypothetical protein
LKSDIRFPNNTQRTSIIGRTGTGKTVIAVYHLSNYDFDKYPWVVYDFKRDSLLAEIGDIPGAEHIGTDYVPNKPGIYFVHPMPDDKELVEQQMWGIWQRENMGVYVDEGYMVCPPGAAPNRAFRALLTQGRSKRIPMIILSQRPVWLDRFVFSESDFYQVLALNHKGDRKTMMEYVPANLDEPLPPYHSYYHDVSKGKTVVMKPVKTDDEILDVFDMKLAKLRKKYKRVIV